MARHAHTPLRQVAFATRLRDARALLLAGDPRAAADQCARLRTRAARAGARGRQAAFGALRAEALLCLGDLAAAEQEAWTAVRTAVPGTPLARWPAAVLAEVLTELGRHEEADRQLRRAASGPLARTADLPRYLRARGRHRLAVRRPAAALADFLRSGDLTSRQGTGLFARIPWRTDAAEALLRLGRPDDAAELIAEQLTTAAGRAPRHRGVALRLRAATEEPARRPATLALAAAELRAAGDHPELARTLADLGDTLRILGDDSAAEAVLRRARHLAADHQAAPLCDRILPPTAPPPPPRSAEVLAAPAGLAAH